MADETTPVNVEKEDLKELLGMDFSGIQEVYWDNIGKTYVFELIR